MMDLADKLATEQAERERNALQRYVELLTDNVDDAAQVEELHSVMDILGKKAGDAQDDAGTIRTANVLAKRIADAKHTGAELREAEAAIPAYENETNRLIDERAAGAQALRRQLPLKQDAYRAARNDVTQLNALKDQNPDLLRSVKPATFADIGENA